MTEVTVYSFLFALTGLLFVGLSVPLIQKRVPPNRFYGFRTPKTLSDPKIWYEVNHISGIDLFLAGALIIDNPANHINPVELTFRAKLETSFLQDLQD